MALVLGKLVRNEQDAVKEGVKHVWEAKTARYCEYHVQTSKS